MNTLSIDFGTSYCAASFLNETAQVVPIVFGINKYNGKCYKFPTVIQYAIDANGEEQKVIGEKALTNLIHSNYGDPSIVSKIKTELRETSGYIINGRPKKSMTIVSDIISEIKRVAEEQAEHTFDCVILTHPAQYESTKQELMVQAANACGFKEVILLEEPKAAAYAFLDIYKLPSDKGAIVFDYGGGTIDIAYLWIVNGTPIFKFPPVSQSKCGGEYIDLLLHNLIISAVDPNVHDISPALLDTCSRTKVSFSTSKHEVIPFNGRAFNFDVNAFNKKIYPKVGIAISLLKDVVERCNSNNFPIDYIFLNGGSSRLKIVTESILQIVPNVEILKYEGIGDDLAVATGAILYHKCSSMTEHIMQSQNTNTISNRVKVRNDVLDKIRERYNQAKK